MLSSNQNFVGIRIDLFEQAKYTSMHARDSEDMRGEGSFSDTLASYVLGVSRTLLARLSLAEIRN